MAKKISAAERKRIQRKAAMARARRAFLKRQAQEADKPEKKDEEEPDMEAKKRQCARLRRRARMLQKRAQELEKEIEPKDEDAPAEEEEVEARKRLQARRRAAIKAAAKRRAMKKRSMRRKAQEEEIPADIEPEPEEETEELVDEIEGRKAAARRARALRRARRAMKRRAQDVSDDLTGPADDGKITVPQGKDVSDDLATPDEGDGGVQQTPAELPDSIDEAEDKVLAAYNLIEAQIARKVVPANVKKAQLASKYAKAYSTAQMRFAAENLSQVGGAGKSASKGVRVSKRSSMPYTKSAAKTGGSMDDYCLFG